MSQSEAIKSGKQVYFNSQEENAFLIEDQEGYIHKYPVDERGLYVREVLPLVDCYVGYVLATSV